MSLQDSSFLEGVSGSQGIYGLDIPHYCYIIQNPSRMRPSTLTPKPEEGRPGCASCHFHAEVTSAGNVETQSRHLARGDVVFQKGCLYCDSTIWGASVGCFFWKVPDVLVWRIWGVCCLLALGVILGFGDGRQVTFQEALANRVPFARSFVIEASTCDGTPTPYN